MWLFRNRQQLPMKKKKVTKEDMAWWTYLILAVMLVFFGLKDSGAAETLLRALREVFSLIIE